MSVRKCLWCLKEEGEVTFEKEAHIIPQSLKAKLLSENECDDCNMFFGNTNPYDKDKKPAIDLVLKESLFVSRYRLLQPLDDVTYMDKKWRSNSTYFDINKKTNTLKIKPRLKLKKSFQKKLGTQFKRGVYKIFLETHHLETNQGFNSQFDFMREYVRWHDAYNTNLPLLYFQNQSRVTISPKDFVVNPQIMFWNGEEGNDFQISGFSTFSLLGHIFVIPLNEFCSINYDFHFNKGRRKFKNIEYFADIDLTLSFLNDKKPIRKRPIIYT